jgi:hypothetical protein
MPEGMSEISEVSQAIPTELRLAKAENIRKHSIKGSE